MQQFHNMGDGDLADRYGEVSARKAACEAELSDLKAEMVRRDLKLATGSRFAVTISEQATTRLDTKALKEALGSSIIAEYEKTSLSTVARARAVASEVA